MSPETPPPPPPFPPASSFPPGRPGPAGPAKTSAAAVASLILGCLSLICFCFTAIPGLICGIVGLSNIGRSNGQLKGKGLAILGIILSLALSAINAIGLAVIGSKQMATNPAFKEIFGTTMGMIQASMNATHLVTALKAHASANGGKLPASLDELVATGAIDTSMLNHPTDGTPGFWKLEQPGGTVLGDLPARTVIVRSAPFTANNESLEIVIYADGKVEPRPISPLETTADPNESHGGVPVEPPATESAPDTTPPAPGQ
jgi:Domain of unknown function (DUF4190)